MPPIRVLLIEDDEDDYLLTSECIEMIPDVDYSVEWHADGMSAVKGACDFKAFDVVLCDYRVGGVTGVEIVEAAKRKRIDTPFILLTGHSDREIDFAAMKAGAADHLVKDQISPAVLEKAIRYALNAAESARQLKKQTELLRATMEATDVGMAAIEADGAVATWNYRLAELLVGLTADEDIVVESIQVLASRPELLAGEALEIPGAEPGAFIEARLSPLPDGGHTLACIDVSKHKAVEDALRSSKDEAERLSSAKSMFIARLSHEMRTPLHAVIGFGEMLSNAGADEVDEYAGIIVHSARSLIAKIDQMLELSRMDLGELRNADREVWPRAVLRDAISAATKADADLNDRLEVAAEIPEAAFRGDQRLLANAVTEFIRNAAKHGDLEANIRVGASERDDGAVALWVANAPDSRLAPSSWEGFELFGDSDPSKAQAHEDLGIGLTYVRSVAGLHGAEAKLAFDAEAREFRASIALAGLDRRPAEPAATRSDAA